MELLPCITKIPNRLNISAWSQTKTASETKLTSVDGGGSGVVVVNLLLHLKKLERKINGFLTAQCKHVRKE